jgi:hypothetical protein
VRGAPPPRALGGGAQLQLQLLTLSFLTPLFGNLIWPLFFFCNIVHSKSIQPCQQDQNKVVLLQNKECVCGGETTSKKEQEVARKKRSVVKK